MSFVTLGSTGCRSDEPSAGAGAQSIIGTDESAWVTRTNRQQPSFVTSAIDAIGALGGNCTAFYIGNSRAVTAGHCFADTDKAIPNGTPCRSWNIKFGYLRDDTDGSHTSTCRHIESHKLSSSGSLYEDYAVIVIDNPPAAQLRVNQSYMPSSNDAVSVVSHPATQPLKYGLCSVSTLSTNPYLTGLLYHTCDTLGGSSGAPVFLRSTGAVIGIHVMGVGSGRNANAFVPIKIVPTAL